MTECGGFGEIWNRAKQTGAEETGDSALENELAADREFEGIDEGEAVECPACHGSRLNPIARHVRLQGHTIDNFTALSAGEAAGLIGKLRFRGNQKIIAADLVPEIQQRLEFMGNVGLGYLALGRSAKTLSGGESQRIRLAAQLGSNLRGVLYVLDEPTIGLHPRDNLRLLETLTALREKGNSLVIVEHDEETMRRADHVIDLGPGAGMHGGEVVVQGTLAEIQAHSEFGNRTLLAFAALSSHAQEPALVRRSRAMDRDSRRAREQSEEHRCALSGEPAFRHHRHFRLGKIDPDALRSCCRR